MKLQDVNPYLRLAVRSVLPPHYHIASRVILDYELIYVESGAFTLTLSGDVYECKAGDLLLLRPGVPHGITVGDEPVSEPNVHFDISHTPDSEQLRIYFSGEHLQKGAEVRSSREDVLSAYGSSPIIRVRDKASFLSLFYSLVASEPPGGPLLKKGILTELLAYVIDDNFPELLSESGECDVERQIRDWIDAGECFDMSLDDIAARFSYNKFHLEKRFRAAYGEGIISYRNERRLAAACELLHSCSVTETAFRCGFSSIYSFSRAFKLRFGVSPLAFKTADEPRSE